jgi:hypothetical protein
MRIKKIFFISLIGIGIFSVGVKLGLVLKEKDYDKNWVVCHFENRNTYTNSGTVLEGWMYIPRKHCKDEPNGKHSVIYSKQTILDYWISYDEENGTKTFWYDDGVVVNSKTGR